MSVKQQIKFKDEINFEADQQDAMKKTEGIGSLADQVERLEGVASDIEVAENNLKELKKGCNGKATKCLTHNLWDELETHINNFFDKKSLEDLVQDNIERRV